MKRKFTALLCSLVLLCVAFVSPFSALAADSSASGTFSVDAKCPTCGRALTYKWWSTLGAEVELKIINNAMVSIPSGSGSLGKLTERCESCGYEKTEWKCLGLQGGSSKPGEWKVEKAPSGIGRKDLPGYADDKGTPSVSYEGNCIFKLEPYYWIESTRTTTKTSAGRNCGFYSEVCPNWQNSWGVLNTDDVILKNGMFYADGRYSTWSFGVTYSMDAPVTGTYTIYKTPTTKYSYLPYSYNGSATRVSGNLGRNGIGYFDTSNYQSAQNKGSKLFWQYGRYIANSGSATTISSLQIEASNLYIKVNSNATDLDNKTNITINNNTWNGNIYTDNSTNLTYIYPQYTTVNEKNETVTNISNTPIIYNNETKQYYTYDQTTKNYYYITYNSSPTPSPSPTPAPTDPSSPSPSPSPAPVDPILPDTQNLIIPKMNSNTFTDEHGTWIASGSSKYSDVFDFFRAFDRSTSEIWETNASPSYLQIEIPDPENYYIDGYIMRISKFNNRYSKDWTLQGSDDGKTWYDLDTQKDQNLSDMEEHKYTLTLRKAYKYYRLNMSNYASSMCSLSHFNLLGYDAKDVVTPTPAPTDPPSPSPAPDPGKPGGSSGSSWWDKLLSKIGDAIIDGLLGAISAVLKLIFKLFSTILGWIIWLTSQVLTLFPFLPPGLGALLIGGVVVCFVIGIIKFIRG